METERLIIDQLNINDKEAYFKNISNNKKVLETFICKYESSLEEFNFDKYLNREDIFAIRLKESKTLIGILTIFDNKNDSIEIGYGLGSDYWNKGYATEAVKCFIDYLFTKDIKTIYASYFEGNLASKRVMEKCNMIYSHTNYNELEYLGKSRNLIYYKINN